MSITRASSRRDALKRMGMLVAGAAALGMPSALTSCVRKERKRIIFYFTATGNRPVRRPSAGG